MMLYKSTKQFKRINPIPAPPPLPKHGADVLVHRAFPEGDETTIVVPYKDTLAPVPPQPPVSLHKAFRKLHKPSDGAAGDRGEFKQWIARITKDNPTVIHVSWGREGAAQQRVSHSYGTPAGALDEFNNLVRSKRKKGYTDVP